MLNKVKSVLRKNQTLHHSYQFLKANIELLPRRMRFATRFSENNLTEFEKATLHDLRVHGIAVLPDFLDTATVAEMKGAIDKAMRDKRYYHAPGKFAFQQEPENLAEIGRLNMIDPTMSSPAFIKFALNPAIRNVIDAYLGIDSVLAGIAAYRTQRTTQHPKGAFHWHYDNAYLQVKAIAYLTDVTVDDGPFAYIPNTWKRRLVSANYDETRIADEDVAPGSIVNCVAKAGTVLIVDTQIIHRATPNLNGDRDVVSIVYDAGTSARRKSFYNLPISTPDLNGLSEEQRRFLRVPPVPGQVI